MVILVCLGAILGAVGIYGPFLDFAGAGASVPLTGFGYNLWKGIKEAVLAAQWLNAKKVIPMHYNTFPPIKVDINDFTSYVESESMIKPIVLNAGEAISCALKC